jgi:hypothetical protein
MAATLTASFILTATDQYTNANSVSTPADNGTLTQKTSYANGTGANKASIRYYTQLVLAAAPQTLDLTALTDVFGTVLTFATNGVKAIVVVSLAAATGQVLKISPGASNPWIGITAPNAGPFNASTDVQILGAGGKWCQESPIDSFGVSATSKTIKFDPGANTFNANLWIIG